MTTEETLLLTDDDLNLLTYERFLEGRKIYTSRSKASKKGYEAHHIIPLCEQGNKNRDDKDIDDRCVRLTPYEHILAHYILARDIKSYGLLKSFFCMIHTNDKKLSEIESLKIKDLKEYGSLIERARIEYSKDQKEKWKDLDRRQKMSEKKKAQYKNNPDLSLSISKNFIVIDPEGNLFEGKNLRRWCRESNIFENWSMAASKLSSRGSYKKYVAKVFDNTSNIEDIKKELYDFHKEKIMTMNERRYHSNNDYLYEVTYPDGRIEKINSLSIWAKENNINKAGKEKLILGKEVNGISSKRLGYRKGCSMLWEVSLPDGNKIQVYNLEKWCRDTGVFENPENAKVYLKRGNGFLGYKAKKVS